MVEKNLGEILRKKREERGLSYALIRKATHLSSRYLKALEDGDYHIFPAQIYFQGTLYHYANFLGIPDSEINPLYNEIIRKGCFTSDGVDKNIVPSYVKKSFPENRKVKFYFYGWLFLGAILTVIFYRYFSQVRFNRPPEETTPALYREIPVSQQVSQPKYEDKLSLRIQTVNSSWLRIIVDGKTVFDGILAEGNEQVWEAQREISLHIGYVRGVRAWLNGKAIDVSQNATGDVNKIFLTKSQLSEKQGSQ